MIVKCCEFHSFANASADPGRWQGIANVANTVWEGCDVPLPGLLKFPHLLRVNGNRGAGSSMWHPSMQDT